jgi:ATP-dependent DNA helicase RecG
MLPDPSTPVEKVSRIDRKIVPALKRLGIATLRDLLFHFPFRYEEFLNERDISLVRAGETVTVRGVIKKASNARTARKNMAITEAVLEDKTGAILAVWFNQPFLLRNFRPGDLFIFSGKALMSPKGRLTLQNPVYERIGKGASVSGFFRTSIHASGLVPIYPETERLSSRWLRYLIHSYLDLRFRLPDFLPPETRRKYRLPELKDALLSIHFPKSREEAERAQVRFAFEELLLLQLRSLREKLRLRQERAIPIPLNLPLVKQFVKSLPFELTNSQRIVIWEIVKDIGKGYPMNRLLEGDVGSGKTVVAAAASLLVSDAGHQTAFLAPTEILARQHYATLSKILSPFGVAIALCTGAEKTAGEGNGVVVGTHALLQEDAAFRNLGLVVVDEQHRFGVEQRAKLTGHAITVGSSRPLLPHFLSMSATPIPRTLALTVFGDLDISILEEMPKVRKTVITKIVPSKERAEAFAFIRSEIKNGRQAFVVCPRIEIPSEPPSSPPSILSQQKLLFSEVKAVTEECRKLSEEIFPDLRIEMLHGKIKPREKDAIMRRFRAGEIDILVSTTVVEVGIDVPNATIMAIEGAEHFGLATLHQLRGRVGRGSEQSYCFLFPSSDGLSSRRLRALLDASNGFELAEKDLEIRGAGDLFGTRQWGVSDVALKRLTDQKLVRASRREAAELLQKSADLSSYPLLVQKLESSARAVHWE